MDIHEFIRRLYQLFCSWPSRVIHPQPSPESYLLSPFLKIRSFVLAKEPILKIADSRLLVLILSRSENMAFIKRAFRSSILSHLAPYSLRHRWSGVLPSINCGCLCAPRGIRLFASCLQIPAEGFGLKHISIYNSFFCLQKPCSGSLPLLCRSNHFSWPVKVIVTP